MRVRTALGVLLLIALAVPAEAQRDKKNTQVAWWRSSWEKALATAADRNVPVVIVVIQDGEEANERLVDGLMKDPSFVKATEGCVPIVCSKKNHGNVRKGSGSNARSECKRFGAVPCEVHLSHEGRMFREFFQGKVVVTPQVMVCDPDLEIIEQILDVEGTPSYTNAIKKARRKLGPGLDREMYEEAQLALTRGRNHVRRKQWVEAMKAVAPALAIGGKSRLVVESQGVLDAIERHVDGVLKASRAAAEKGDYWTALPPLDELRRTFKGTAIGSRVQTAFDRMRKTKAGKAVAAKLKKQARYLPMLEKAQAYERKADFARAREQYDRICARAKGLPVAKTAAARLEAFKKDAAIAKLLAADLLDDAAKLEKRGKTDKAKLIYTRIVKDYPETPAAKKALAALGSR